MLRQERTNDPEEALRLALIGWQSEIWTSLPGILQSFDPEKMTCVVQPAVKGIFRLKDGSDKIVTMPLCTDVPVSFPTGGGYTLTFPMAEGDEGMLIFSARCFDAWWQNGGIQPQAEILIHDLSNGMFIPGIRSVPRALADISTNSVQLRADDGSAYVDIAEAQMTLKHPTKVVVDSPAVQFTGDVTMDKKLTVTDLTTVGAGTEFVKLASGANATELEELLMRYRKLSPTGDYTFGQGNANFWVNNREAVAQSIKTRLLLEQGEWFLDITSGTPYSTQILGTNTAATRDLAIKTRILKTPGVLELVAYASKVIDRNFTVQAVVNTIYGQTPIEVAFP